MPDILSDAAAAEFTALLQRVAETARREGFLAGRREERARLRLFHEKYDETFPLEAEKPDQPPAQAAQVARREETAERRLQVGMLTDLVKDAVVALAPTNPDGADPSAIIQLLQSQGHGFDMQQIRTALRHLMLNGHLIRVSRGRYLPPHEGGGMNDPPEEEEHWDGAEEEEPAAAAE